MARRGAGGQNACQLPRDAPDQDNAEPGYCWSKNFRAMAPCVAAPPARNAAARNADSTSSSRVAPAAFAALECASMQYGHWVVQATATAMSSRNFRGIAPPSRATMLLR